MTLTSAQLTLLDQRDLARRAVNLLDAGEVERFHAEPQVQCQTVGLHSWGVAGILIAMGVLIQPEDRWLLGAAILHDADERRNGDVPFPVKRSSPEIKSLMDRLALQEQMDNLFVITALSKRQQTLLKLADMLEGLHWCLSGKERRNQQVSHKWMKALLQMLLDEHQTLEEGEAERFWQIMCAVIDIHPDWHGSMYSTFQAFLNTNPPKP